MTITLHWDLPRQEVALSPDQVHVWKASLDVTPERLSQLERSLSPDERYRARQFSRSESARQFVVGRGILRRILAHYLETTPEQLTFTYGAQGKPSITQALAPNLAFNLSHTGAIALVALAQGRRVGIDVEQIRLDLNVEALARVGFSPAEQAALAALPATQRRGAFYAGWTKREAFVKALGLGLTAPLEQFDVALTSQEPAALLRVGWDAGEPARWRFFDLSCLPHYAAALAVEGHDWQLSCLHYEPDAIDAPC